VTKPIRILNFDGSVVSQKGFMACFRPTVIDCADLGPSSRLWMNKKNAGQIKQRLAAADRGAMTFLGSGDFHHVSAVLLEQFTEPLNVIIFDFHPDWDILPPRLGCGSWVNEALRRRNVKKAVLLGVSSEDISARSIRTGNLGALRKDRVEIYPYFHPPTATLVRRVPENISIKVKRSLFRNTISWSGLKGRDLTDFINSLAGRLETKKVYVSIDKDCLSSAWALTNWEKGLMELEELLVLLRLIKEKLEIVGVDVTGEYSLPVVKGNFKDYASRLDHPKDYSAFGKTENYINSINQRTNIALAELLR